MLAIRHFVRSKRSSAKKIICVDDNDFVLEILDWYLESQGFVVVPCSSGFRALELLDSEAPDAMTCDFEMPGMDGAELTAAIRAKKPDIPIVMFSGSTEIPQATLDLVDRFVSKDAVNAFVAVGDALDSVLPRKKSRRAAAASVGEKAA